VGGGGEKCRARGSGRRHSENERLRRDRQNLPFIVAGKGGGTLKPGRFIADAKGNQGDLLTTLLACAGVPLDRPIGIATKQIKEMMASA